RRHADGRAGDHARRPHDQRALDHRPRLDRLRRLAEATGPRGDRRNDLRRRGARPGARLAPRVPPRVTSPFHTRAARTAPDRNRCLQALDPNCRGWMNERVIWPESGEIDDPGMTRTNGRAFNEWLRAQLKAKKMSQRQLAQQSGVDHSTISRLVRGDRMPSLGTATKLARGLRELGENDDGPQYLG